MIGKSRPVFYRNGLGGGGTHGCDSFGCGEANFKRFAPTMFHTVSGLLDIQNRFHTDGMLSDFLTHPGNWLNTPGLKVMSCPVVSLLPG